MTCSKIWTGMKKPGRDDMYKIFQKELKTGKELIRFSVEYDDDLTQTNPYCQCNPGYCVYKVTAEFAD